MDWSQGDPGHPRAHLLPLHDSTPCQELVVDNLDWARNTTRSHCLREDSGSLLPQEFPRSFWETLTLPQPICLKPAHHLPSQPRPGLHLP